MCRLFDRHSTGGYGKNTAGAGIIRAFGQKTAAETVQAGLPELYPRLWRFCLSLTGSRDLAADLAQDTCQRALDKATLFDPETHLDRWLFTMARRIWLNDLRAQAVRRGNGLVAVSDVEMPDESTDSDANIFLNEVFKSISALPEHQRVTVLLVYVEGYAYKEAAEMLEIPIGTVMSRLAAARAKLSTELSMKDPKT